MSTKDLKRDNCSLYKYNQIKNNNIHQIKIKEKK